MYLQNNYFVCTPEPGRKIPIKAKVNPLGIAKICNINYYTYTPEIFDGFRVFAHLSQGVTILVAEITDCTIFQ